MAIQAFFGKEGTEPSSRAKAGALLSQGDFSPTSLSLLLPPPAVPSADVALVPEALSSLPLCRGLLSAGRQEYLPDLPALVWRCTFQYPHLYGANV